MSTGTSECDLTRLVLWGCGVMMAVCSQAALGDDGGSLDYPAYVDVQSDTRVVISLSGKWQFHLDNGGAGEGKRLFEPDATLDSNVVVPGAWRTPPFGKRGAGWCKRKVRAPRAAQPCRIWLKIGAAHPSCQVWINGRTAGSVKQPGVPTRLDVTELLRLGDENDITIKVCEENRGLGNWYNLHPQWWSGLWRRVELEISRDPWIDDLWVVPDIDRSTAVVRATIASARSEVSDVGVEVEIVPLGFEGVCSSTAMKARIAAHQKKAIEIAVPLNNARLWSPRTPFLYEATVRLVKGREAVDAVKDRFGMRKVETRGQGIYLNNKPIYLRGYGDDGYYPQTLCPETNVDLIKTHLRMTKEYGFNYAYPCLVMQPEEYLDAADEVGMLVKYDAGAPLAFQRGGPGELPAGITSGEKHRLVAEQWSAILHWTQNHPSLIIYSTGSELKADPLLTELHRMAKRKDRTRLVLSWADETDVFESGVGLSEPLDPSEEIHRRLRSHGVLPHLIHEYGAPESLSSYSAQAAAAAKRLGVEDLFPTFIINSRKLAASTRKLMIEEARKTKGFAGYAMWLIQDIPGYPQGIFDYHWRPKGLAAEKFLQSNGPVALLMHEASCKTRRCFTAGERVTFEVLASNFEDAPIRGELVWRISDRSTGAVLGAGTTSRVKSEPYSSGGLGAVEITMPETARPAAATLSMAVDDEGRRLKNDWPIWLFPKDLLSSAKTKIGIYERSEQALAGIRRVFPFVGGFDQNTDLAISSLMDDRLMKYLLDGGDVMLIVPANHSLWAATETRFQSRWPNSEGGANINATIIRDHSLLADFPHDGYCDYQFYNLIGAGGGGSALKVPSRLHPIVEVFNTDSRAAYLFEARVGKGKLLATTFRFAETVSGFPESAYLFSLLLDYAGGSAFLPQARLTADDIEKFGFAGYVVLDLARGERARIRGACLSGGGLAKYPDSTVGGRRCNWVYAASTPYHTMTLQFKLTEAPSHDLALAVEGAHYPAAGGDKVDIRIAVNGSTLVEGPSEFPTGRFGLRQYRIARELLQEGMNTLSISNLEPKGPAGDAPFFAVDFLEFRIENEPGRHESCTAARSQSAAAESLVDNRRADNSHGDGQREQSDRPSMDPVISCGGAKPWADRSAWRLWSPFRYWADGRLSRS